MTVRVYVLEYIYLDDLQWRRQHMEAAGASITRFSG